MTDKFEQKNMEFEARQALINETRNRPARQFKFPEVLERQFFLHFEELAKKSFKTSYLFMTIPVLLIIHLGVMGVTLSEFWETLIAALKSIIFLQPALQGTLGVYVMHVLTVSLVVALWPLQSHKVFQKKFQLKLSIATAIILAMMAINLAMSTDPRYIFSQQMELVATFLFVFVLLRMQVVYLFVNQCIAFILTGLAAFSLNLQPNWAELSALVVAMSGFGFIYAIVRELHERENFLLLAEIENEKKQFEFLHKQIEKENLLKAELSRFYSVMSGEKDLFRLGEKILNFLVPEVKANVGSLYVLKHERLFQIGQHGLSDKQTIRKTIKFGEGLVGQCALEKRTLLFNESPESFQIIQSGLGKLSAPALSLIAIKFDDELVGVIELASIKPLTEDALEFLEAANRSVATALKAVSAKTQLEAA